MKACELILNQWYKAGPELLQVAAIKPNRYGEMSVYMQDGRHYSFLYDGDIFTPCLEPERKIENETKIHKKEKDSQYYSLVDRHKLLCSQKLQLNKQGRNKTMRNAYINQELELIRTELFQY